MGDLSDACAALLKAQDERIESLKRTLAALDRALAICERIKAWGEADA